MTNDKKLLTGIIVLVLPLFVLAGMTVKAATQQQVGQQVWKVKITGYDPRDLIYGHYLRFRYDWNIVPNASSSNLRSGTELSMCVNSSGDGHKNPVVYPMDGAMTRTACESVMKIYRHGSRYTLQRNPDPEKYFIPEENASEIDRLFRTREVTFYMELMAHKNGSVAVRDLYVDDIPLDEYLRNLPKNSTE